MGWNESMEEDRKTLRRIVALLLALAGLCERASLRSPAVRAAVMWLLRPGEVIAGRYVAALTGSIVDPPAPPAVMSAGDGAADAMNLALRFRALAAALAAVLAVLVELCAPPSQAGSVRRDYGPAASAAARGVTAAVGRRDSS